MKIREFSYQIITKPLNAAKTSTNFTQTPFEWVLVGKYIYTCSLLASDAVQETFLAAGYFDFGASQLSFLHRFRQLWQSSISTSCHSGNERVSDRHEAPQSPAQALKERQQTVLILALGPLSCYTARVSPHCCHGYQTGTPGGRGEHEGEFTLWGSHSPVNFVFVVIFLLLITVLFCLLFPHERFHFRHYFVWLAMDEQLFTVKSFFFSFKSCVKYLFF